MKDWKECKLGDVYDFASGLSKPREDFGFGYPFVSFKDVFQNYFLPKHLSNLANTTEKERETFSIKRGDAFLTRTSETQEELGMSSVALRNYPNATFNGFTKRLRPNKKGKEEIIPEYAGFYFRSPRFRSHVTSMSSITTRASLNNDMLGALSILLPPLPEQRVIAAILSSLDDKIDLLHRQNKTLEAMAETLFRQWFVNNDELRMQNDEWKIGKLGDIATFYNGKSRPTEFGTIPIYGGNGILGYTNISNYSGKSIIIGRVGAYCGSLYFENKDIWISDNALLVKANNEKQTFFLLYLLKSLELNSMAEGSSHPLLTQTLLKSIDISIPPDKQIELFDNQLNLWTNKIDANNKQIRTLEKLRDNLLPKLMSGEVRVAV